MRTLSQIRADNAIQWKDKLKRGKKDGNAVSGFPALIVSNGLLSALAYSCEEKREGMKKNEAEHSIAAAVANHLQTKGIEITKAATPEDLVSELAKAQDASQLRKATREAVEFLNFLKRFAVK